jgi:hypothetical protein
MGKYRFGDTWRFPLARPGLYFNEQGDCGVRQNGGQGMSTVRLKGQDAVNYATAHGLMLNKSADQTGEERKNLSVEEARRIAEENPASIWLEIRTGVYPADDH